MIPWYTVGGNASHDGWAFNGKYKHKHELCDNIKLSRKHIWPEFCYSTVAMIPQYPIGRNGSPDGWFFNGKHLLMIRDFMIFGDFL